jgi:hypothetical protein
VLVLIRLLTGSFEPRRLPNNRLNLQPPLSRLRYCYIDRILKAIPLTAMLEENRFKWKP